MVDLSNKNLAHQKWVSWETRGCVSPFLSLSTHMYAYTRLHDSMETYTHRQA
jgi:hypothetical protein